MKGLQATRHTEGVKFRPDGTILVLPHDMAPIAVPDLDWLVTRIIMCVTQCVEAIYHNLRSLSVAAEPQSGMKHGTLIAMHRH